MKQNLLIYFLLLLFLACNNAEQKNDDTKEAVTQTEPKTTETTSVVNTLDIKIPKSPDAELNEFFKAYTSHLNEYINAVRDNNRSQIKTSFQRKKNSGYNCWICLEGLKRLHLPNMKNITTTRQKQLST